MEWSVQRQKRREPPTKQAPVQIFGLFFYFFDRMNLPPMSADFGVVAGDSFYGDGLANWGQIARKPGNAFGDDAAVAIHALDFGVFANADVGVAVGSFCHLGDESTDRGMRGHSVGPAIGIFGNQLIDGKFSVNNFGGWGR